MLSLKNFNINLENISILKNINFQFLSTNDHNHHRSFKKLTDSTRDIDDESLKDIDNRYLISINNAKLKDNYKYENLYTKHENLCVDFYNNSSFYYKSNVFNICGNNNSGKTVLLEALLGLIEYDGAIFWQNKQITSLSQVDKNLIYIGHARSVQNYLTLNDTLKMWSILYNSNKLSQNEIQDTIQDAIKYWNLENIRNYQIKELSSGTIKKIELAKLICCKSSLWVLDEPHVNLDDASKKKLINLLSSTDAHIIITSHKPINYNYLCLN